MNKLTIADLCLDRIGHDVHLVGTIWKDYSNDLTYIVPITADLQTTDNYHFIETDTFDNLRILNCAWLLEGKRYMGFQSEATRTALARSQRQIEPNIMWKVFRRDGFTCFYCGDKEGAMTYDHYIPRAHGGATTLENGRTSCKSCNKNKADMAPEEWLESNKLKKRKELIVRENKKNAAKV